MRKETTTGPRTTPEGIWYTLVYNSWICFIFEECLCRSNIVHWANDMPERLKHSVKHIPKLQVIPSSFTSEWNIELCCESNIEYDKIMLEAHVMAPRRPSACILFYVHEKLFGKCMKYMKRTVINRLSHLTFARLGAMAATCCAAASEILCDA